ncbi:MAG: adenosylcobinamide-GDP ribazoletransferase [Thiohalorhabdus sp.]
MHPALLAVADLTLIPVPGAGRASPADHARAAPWYPLAGLVAGAALVAGALLLQGLPTLLAALLVTALWVGLTGASHLRGLAETLGALAAGGGNRRRTLRIMRADRPRAWAVGAVVLMAAAKAAAVGCLIHHQLWAGLLAAPVAGRVLLTALLATTPHAAEPGDLPWIPRMDRAAVLVGTLAGAILVALTVPGPLAALGALGLLAVLLRWTAKRVLGGFNTPVLDTACELGEVAVLGAALLGPGGCLSF